MEVKQNFEHIMNRYPKEKRFSLAILQDIQREFDYVPKSALEQVSAHLSIPLSQLYGMATFYKALSLTPKGKYVIKVCDGTACHIRSSNLVLNQVQELLHLKTGEVSADGFFSLETVNCVGACALAPVMVIQGEYYGKVSPSDIERILQEYRDGLHDSQSLSKVAKGGE